MLCPTLWTCALYVAPVKTLEFHKTGDMVRADQKGKKNLGEERAEPPYSIVHIKKSSKQSKHQKRKKKKTIIANPKLPPSSFCCSVPLSAVKDGAKITIDSLRTPPSAYSKHIRYGALEFSPLLDSSSISSPGWAQIANAVRDNYHLFDGFVVLHGTDSLSYSASALSFMLVSFVVALVVVVVVVVVPLPSNLSPIYIYA